MTVSHFGPDDVRVGEALQRCVAHAEACSELYGRGRKADALLHAARPITDVLPWVENELRAYPEPFSEFTAAVSAVGAGVRINVRPRKLRKIAEAVEGSVDRLLETIAGSEAVGLAYRASVALELMRSAANAYERAVSAQSLGDYQAAHALAGRAAHLLNGESGISAELSEHLDSLRILLPSLEPPANLATPRALAEVVDAIHRICVAELNAIVSESGSLDDSLTRLERLVDDVVSSYAGGVPALSARLAASLYVRSYEAVRPQVAAVDEPVAGRLAELLGIELRRSINDGAPADRVAELGAESKTLLGSLRSAPTA
jgi:hypothetical protein